MSGVRLAGRPTAGQNFNVGHYMQTLEPNYFHTCHAYRHSLLLPLYTAFTDLDLAWGSQGL